MFALTGYRPALLAMLCAGSMLAAGANAADDAPAAPAQAEQVFARINDRVVTMRELSALYAATMRQRYYHGKVPEGQAEAVRKEVADLLVDRVLQQEDAARRGLKPDAAKIDKAVAEYDTRYAASPAWQKAREQVLPTIRAQLEQQNLLEQLDKLQRTVAPPSADDVRKYYDRHLELFTEPEKLHLSVILLKVDPSSPPSVRNQAREDAQALFARLGEGADFAELARQNSGDESAANGGDLGYIHRGMLPEELHGRIDSFEVGTVIEPIDMLEGAALFRLDGREAARLREFGDVENQARELLVRELEGLAKKAALGRLRSAASIEILAPVVPDGGGKMAPPAAGDGNGNKD